MDIGRLDFWYEFASTYSYPAAMRVEREAEKRGIEIAWRPFLLGPIFADQGWRNSPFNLYPVKGRYMWRDMERICAGEGLSFTRPNPFPQNSLLAARVALTLEEGARAAFSKRVFAAEFSEGRSISEAETIASILASLAIEPHPMLEFASSEPTKLRLKEATEEAKRLGIFGAPAFVTADGELFWGNDRLEAALDWAAARRSMPSLRSNPKR